MGGALSETRVDFVERDPGVDKIPRRAGGTGMGVVLQAKSAAARLRLINAKNIFSQCDPARPYSLRNKLSRLCS